MPTTLPFSAYGIGVLPRHSASALCPAFNVIALSSLKSGHVIVHDLHKFKPRWSHAPAQGARATSLAWREDGRVLAVGCDDGAVRLLDAEEGNVLHEFVLPVPVSHEDADAAAVVALDWTRHVDANAHRDRSLPPATDFLPPLPPYSKASLPGAAQGQAPESALFLPTLLSTPTSPDTHTHTPSPLERARDDPIDVLVAVTADGGVHLVAYGVFYLGAVTLPEDVADRPDGDTDPDIPSVHPSFHHPEDDAAPAPRPLKHPLIESARISPDLSRLHIAVSALLTDPLPPPDPFSASTRVLHALTIDTRHVHARPRLVARLAGGYVAYKRIAGYVAQGVRQAEKEWTVVKALVGRWRDRLSGRLSDMGDRTDAATSLLLFVGAGTCSSAVEEWLVREVGEQGLRSWEKTVDNGLMQLRQLCHAHLIPAVERIMAIVADLVAVAESDQTFQPSMTLNASAARACVKLASQMAGRLLQLADEVDEARRCMWEFAKWCKWAILSCTVVDKNEFPRINFDHELVARFISGPFSRDPLAPFFTTPVHPPPRPASIENVWNLDPLGSTATIKSLHERLETECEDIFRMPAAAIVASMTCSRCIPAWEVRDSDRRVYVKHHFDTRVVWNGYTRFSYFVFYDGKSDFDSDPLGIYIARIFCDEIVPTSVSLDAASPLPSTELAKISLRQTAMTAAPNTVHEDTPLTVLDVEGVGQSIAVALQVHNMPGEVLLLRLAMENLEYIESRSSRPLAEEFERVPEQEVFVQNAGRTVGSAPLHLLTKVPTAPFHADEIYVVSGNGKVLGHVAVDKEADEHIRLDHGIDRMMESENENDDSIEEALASEMDLSLQSVAFSDGIL
ncbi:hypothetical protein M427DRAFT_134745 [Gonapodya prolifera JEL478]|uniref:Anaphase-promoting complex subunit 4 n=1 Tax=Gonapodya prolifera (strain JEL478) TaxID=1344416 RepID=A0A139AGS7_GONPJ|nr:hypothetical protein M427DRAFT_134745 [Gonapodya prolifera JEL478]|eukprot:KXS15948.1 hypothetical protein M427DRAFT_134745 [Gonapodya prolifera JEL478]